LAAGWLGGFAHILAVLSAQVYNLYLARTNWSWLPYAISFSLLPLFIAQSSSPALFPSWQIVSISICVGVIAHIFNALPDIDLDKRSNLGGAIVALGKARAITLAAVLSAVILALLAQLLVS
jgi:4-hydroxybenzoate polyprenyltransferase